MRMVGPGAAGAPALWAAVAQALLDWQGNQTRPWVILVPRGRMVAPLQQALRVCSASNDQPWVPPAVRSVSQWLDVVAPGRGADRLGLMLRIHRALVEALPERMQQSAPAEQLAFAQGLAEVLAALAHRVGPQAWTQPEWVARWAAQWGPSDARAPLAADLAVLQRIGSALGGEVQAALDAEGQRAQRAAGAWARRRGRLAWVSWQAPGPDERGLWSAVAQALPESDRLVLGLDWRAVGRHRPVLMAAWPEAFGAPLAHLAERRAAWQQEPGGVVPEILHAADRESEAQCAVQWVVARVQEARAVQQPDPRLAILVIDRWLARRVQALLERAAVVIDDREGWLVSTTVAATAVLGWLDTVAHDGHHDDLTAWLESRFVHLPEHGAITQWVDHAVTRQRYVRGWTGLVRVKDDGQAPPSGLQEAYAHAQAGRRTQTLEAHLQTLDTTLRWAGVLRRLAGDAAGRQVLGLLERLRGTAMRLQSERVIDFAEFRALCIVAFEQHRFFAAVDSPVVLTSPSEAAGGDFDGVLVLGAAQGHLPAPPASLPVVNEPVRAWLGLPTTQTEAQRQQRDLIMACALAPKVAITCRTDPLEGVAPSSWIERIQVMLASDSDAGWADDVAHPGMLRSVRMRPSRQPAVRLQGLPNRLSVGSIQRLVACPYRFLVRDGWRLAEAREAVDAPGARERGELVHEILYRWHAELAAAAVDPRDVDRAQLRAGLVAVTEAVADRELAHGGALLGQIAEWRAMIDRYLEWMRQDLGQGWQWRAGEQDSERVVALALPAAGTVRIHGRLDRLDQGPEGWRVMDYKLGQRESLTRDVREPERAVQLALYAWMASAAHEVVATGYLSLRRDEVRWLKVTDPVEAVVADWEDRVQRLLTEVAHGVPLAASGQDCAHCSSRGICRKGHW